MDETNTIQRRRSERVVLNVPVILQVETLGRRSHQDAHTMVVNAHGGLLRSDFQLINGQTITLINPKTQMEEICRVIRVESLKNKDFAIAFEFGRPAPHFWPVVFPPADWESLKV